jgi:hypothetical protein
MKLLCRDIYNFAGNEICINSNSTELLGHLRAVYGRFLKETYEPSSIDDKLTKVKSGLEIEIIDNLASANEITINDGFYLSRLSPYNGSYKCISENLLNKSQRTGTCDLLHFVQTVILRTITLLISDYHLFHAGVVSWRNRGIILPAHPDMGKTTMVIKLVMSGCRFLSDEIACFDPDLSRIEAFPRRLSIRNNSRKLLGLPEWSESMDVVKTADNEWMLDIEDIVPDSLSETCTPDFIFFLRGFGDRPRVEQIPESVSLLELLKFTYCAVDDPALLLFKCAPLINKLRCYNVISGSLDETAELIIEEVDRRSLEDG